MATQFESFRVKSSRGSSVSLLENLFKSEAQQYFRAFGGVRVGNVITHGSISVSQYQNKWANGSIVDTNVGLYMYVLSTEQAKQLQAQHLEYGIFPRAIRIFGTPTDFQTAVSSLLPGAPNDRAHVKYVQGDPLKPTSGNIQDVVSATRTFKYAYEDAADVIDSREAYAAAQAIHVATNGMDAQSINVLKREGKIQNDDKTTSVYLIRSNESLKSDMATSGLELKYLEVRPTSHKLVSEDLYSKISRGAIGEASGDLVFDVSVGSGRLIKTADCNLRSTHFGWKGPQTAIKAFEEIIRKIHESTKNQFNLLDELRSVMPVNRNAPYTPAASALPVFTTPIPVNPTAWGGSPLKYGGSRTASAVERSIENTFATSEKDEVSNLYDGF